MTLCTERYNDNISSDIGYYYTRDVNSGFPSVIYSNGLKKYYHPDLVYVNKGDISLNDIDESNDTCPISCEKFNINDKIFITECCKKYFTLQLLIESLNENNKCPYCRTIVNINCSDVLNMNYENNIELVERYLNSQNYELIHPYNNIEFQISIYILLEFYGRNEHVIKEIDCYTIV